MSAEYLLWPFKKYLSAQDFILMTKRYLKVMSLNKVTLCVLKNKYPQNFTSLIKVLRIKIQKAGKLAM